ncbi:MAG: thiamine diphosphokinase [Anaerolineae bacterium]
MRVFIVGGSPTARVPHRLAPQPGDLVIAADRGAEHGLAWGWPIHILIGDLDSLPETLTARLQNTGIEILTAPPEKDETDVELALRRAVMTGPQEIILCGALGGRTDHLLANVLLLTRPDLSAHSLVLADGPETVRLLHNPEARKTAQIRLTGTPGDLVSLLPWAGDAEGISTEGLYYPLRDETLFLGHARGISNVMLGSHASINLRRGSLFVIHMALPAELNDQIM